MVRQTLAIAAAAALTLGAPASGAGECPDLARAVEQRVPGLSSAVHVRVQPGRGGPRVQVADRQGRALDDQPVEGEGCAAQADLAARRIRAWAESHGAWREAGALPQPPLVDAPEEPKPAAQPEERAPAAPAEDEARPPLRLGIGAGAGAIVDSAGGAAGYEAWVLVGPARSPFWAEAALLLTPERALAIDRFAFTFNRGFIVAFGGAYRLARAPLEVVAGLQFGRLVVAPVGPVDAAGFSTLDGGGYGGLRALLPLGVLTGWVGARLSAWFVQHELEISGGSGAGSGAVPGLGVWFGVGVQAGNPT